jgi:hypothetical protein
MGPSSLSCLGLLLGVGYRIGELMKVGIKDAQEAAQGAPLHIDATVLHSGDIRFVKPLPLSHLPLRHPSLAAQLMESTSEHLLISLGCRALLLIGHGRTFTRRPGWSILSCDPTSGARGAGTPGRLAPEALTPGTPATLPIDGAWLPCQSSSAGASDPRRNR